MASEKPRREVLAFARRLRRLRMRRGLTQRELAALCGLAPQQVSHYEAGRYRPHARNLAKLAEALRVPVPTLAGSLDARRARLRGRAGG